MELQAPCQEGMSPRAGRRDASAADISASAEIATAFRLSHSTRLTTSSNVTPTCGRTRLRGIPKRHRCPAAALGPAVREPSRPGSLRRELLARELDLVGEDDELLAAVEADGEELAADVLAQRDESPRRGSSNDATRERDRAHQAAARPWKDRHGCSVAGSGGEGGQIEPRPFERPTETHLAPVHHPDDGGHHLGPRARVLGDRIHEIDERDGPYHCRALRLGAERKFYARRAPKVPTARPRALRQRPRSRPRRASWLGARGAP